MRYATRMDCLEDKSLLSVMEIQETDDMILFTGGFPSPETYPLEEITDAFIKTLEREGKAALSYCSTSGHKPLREVIRHRMKRIFDLDYNLDEVIITSGSQQGLDMSAMLFINKGDVVLFETPSYLGAVSALRAHEAQLVAIPTDRQGLELNALKQALDQYGDKVKMIYVNPDFQNPTGRSWSEQRRIEFMEMISQYDVAVLEDAAYSELAYDNKPQKPLSYYDKKGQVVYIGTFSKTFCPGLRVAWLCARGEMMQKYLVLKNAADLSSSAIAQMQMAYYLTHYDLDAHIAKISRLYKHRRDVMAKAIKENFPEEIQFVLPAGGLFIWLELPVDYDTRKLLPIAMENKVAFVPGTAFYPNASRSNEMRLNFSNMKDEDLVKGIRILANVTKRFMKER
ncbi:PLP-dependent aminotransferase family protein [Clostridium aminobutyricum]|uniref:PLP-dependent aminotransferase family protein n=1 Tax=Clostridium aminobutyricum TaxID=33953 RepID=A0A939D9Z8_CLOAM|nr:PLP-dependent aminotransferase family protein [Clostridium aminobutyricum]MBN7773850.1 PLP-dependent aminotransferase family protein [Clostridium aminobutyricum]